MADYILSGIYHPRRYWPLWYWPEAGVAQKVDVAIVNAVVTSTTLANAATGLLTTALTAVRPAITNVPVTILTVTESLVTNIVLDTKTRD